MNQHILKQNKSRTWLSLVAIVDTFTLLLLILFGDVGTDNSLLHLASIQIFIVILVSTNIWFVFDYLHTSLILKRDHYKRDYEENQIRFAFICHVYDPSNSGETISLSKFQAARMWFYDKLSIQKSMRDDIAVCMTTLDGCYKSDINFTENLKSYVEDHPIENVYYTGIQFSNEQFPYMQCSKLFSPKRENGMTLMFVCETSMLFFEQEVEARLKHCLYNQERTTLPLTKLFETGGMKNSLQIKLEFHKLSIS